MKPVPAKSAMPPALPAPPEPRNLADLQKSLTGLGLEHAAIRLSSLVSDSIRENKGPIGFLQALLEEEVSRREERRIRTSLRLSSLPTGLTIGSFDFAYQPSVERSKIELLSTGEWIRQKQSLLIMGPPGVGKTHLAVALGVKAVETGFSVAFYRLEELLFDMRKDADVAPTKLRRKGYMKTGLLIIDEVGFQPLSRQDANLLFRLVSYRYQRGSICITSNKSVKEWPEMFAGDEILTTALLDRLLHNSQVLNIKGRSYRLKDLEKSLRDSH
ncbi:MAG: IS21-like element helper ATPase IstB [Acidobacteriota bacterium]